MARSGVQSKRKIQRTGSATQERKLTRREYLQAVMMSEGYPIMMINEAISSVAIEHPEWDMEELKTWNEWRLGR